MPRQRSRHRSRSSAPAIRHAFPKDEAAKRDAIHRSLLTGLLSSVGKKLEKDEKSGNSGEYAGARSVKFNLFPGSSLFKAKPQWIMASELVETSRLYARNLAPINPEWIEDVAPQLLSTRYGDPYWDRASGKALVKAKLTYHGLVVVPARTFTFGKVDPRGARNLFIHHALVEGEIDRPWKFLIKNHELLEDIRYLEQKARRRDLVADASRLFFFYDTKVPNDITNVHAFSKRLKEVEAGKPNFLQMTREDVLAADVADITEARFPDELRIGNHVVKLRYRYEFGHPADGVTAIIPLEMLAGLSAAMFDRLVPGFLEEKVDSLIRTLPKDLRVKFVPVPQTVSAILPAAGKPEGGLTDALAKALSGIAGVEVKPDDFRPEELPVYLQMNYRVVDHHGKTLAAGRDLAALRKELGIKQRSVFAELPQGPFNRDGLTSWDFDELPKEVEIQIAGLGTVTAYPAVVDKGDTVSLRLMESPESAQEASRAGIRKLFALQLQKEMAHLEKSLPNFEKMALHFRPLGTSAELKTDLLAAAAERALVGDHHDIRTRDEFIRQAQEGWRRLAPAAADIAKVAAEVLESRNRIEQQMTRTWPELLVPSVRDVQEQVASLINKRFLSTTPAAWLPHLPRFMKAAESRLTKLLNAGAGKDIEHLKTVRPFWRQYQERARQHAEQHIKDPELENFRWMLEELRVSAFAQELKTSIPISPQRLERQWEKVRPAR